MRAFRRIQICADVFKPASPNSWIKEEKRTGARIVSEVENVPFDENLQVLKFVELKHIKLKKINSTLNRN